MGTTSMPASTRRSLVTSLRSYAIATLGATPADAVRAALGVEAVEEPEVAR